MIEGVVVRSSSVDGSSRAGREEEGLAVTTDKLDLLCGNFVIVKPSEVAPVSHVVLHSVERRIHIIYNTMRYQYR